VTRLPKKQQHIRSGLTEHTGCYRLYNPNLASCYNALKPESLSGLAMYMFLEILNTKRYRKDDESQESTRIFSNRMMTANTILRERNPEKYILNGKSTSTDVSNLLKKIKELNDKNIIYTWHFGRPPIIMAIIEREIGVWTYYNPEACVPPKSLKKIVNSTSGMINTMKELCIQDGRTVYENSVERSFGQFLNGIIMKMNPDVINKLNLWNGGDIWDYIVLLQSEIRCCSPYEGLYEDETFMMRLPPSVAKLYEYKLNGLKDEQENNENDGDDEMQSQALTELESQIVPEDGNLVSLKKKSKSQPKMTQSTRAKTENFPSIDPFANPTSFIKFYHSCVKIKYPNANLSPIRSETIGASKILDLLTENNLNGNREFLRGWIAFFIDCYLKGRNSEYLKQTCVQNLFCSFKDYLRRRASSV
jgi:hypothetical protein